SARQLMAELAEISYRKYVELKNHPQFIPYLERRSPLRFYEMVNIGSRPGRRGLKQKLDLTDLRAIPFVGAWSQLKQNIPGYYGIGTALQTLTDNGRLEDLKRLYREVAWFKALALNSMMALSKCDFNLTRYMRQDAEFGEFWQMLFDEYQRSKTMLLEISGLETLMADEPVSRESIKIREEIVLPLLVVQQYALQKVLGKNRHEKVYEKIVTRSLYGNINASRNSA
ncbi:MAG: phosphoenolpyruvate carboxylase, partial [Candidatus Marinimicrobia bacterium]|nr:phosphoenolpyruvate carboxylase [Candidatus Neomarinimicrobiota bacterium]